VPSRTSIIETITKVTANPPKIKPKLTISAFEKIFFDIKVTFREHPYLSTGCVLGVAFGCLSWFRGRIRRTRGGGHFKIEDAVKDFKGPVLGGGGNRGSKAD
jgi:protein disulfide-isomerase